MAVKRYRITADVYAYDLSVDERESGKWHQVEAALRRIFPLGVVEGYPDIQEITERHYPLALSSPETDRT